MAIEKLILYSLCLVTSIGKSHQNITTSVLPVSSQSIQDTATLSTSALSSSLSSVSTELTQTPTISMSKSMIDHISTDSSVLVLGSTSTTTEISPSTTVSQSVHSVTQNILNMNSTTDENEFATTLNPGSSSTDFSFNKWSNTFPGITSHTGSTAFTNLPIEHTTMSQNNSENLGSITSKMSISSLVNESSEESISSTLHTSVPQTATSDVLATETFTKSSDSLNSSPATSISIQSSEISDKSILSTGLPEEISSPSFYTSSTSGFVSSSRFDLPPISSSALSDSSTSTVSISKSVLPSLSTDYFAASVYSLANISATYVSDIISAESSTRSAVTSVIQSETTVASTTHSLSLDKYSSPSPTHSFYSLSDRITVSAQESIYSSETEIHLSSVSVSSSPGYYSDISLLSSSTILTSDTFQTLNVNRTPTLNSMTRTFSTPLISITLSEVSNQTVSTYSAMSSRSYLSRGSTQGAPVSTTIIEASVITSTSQTTSARPTNKPLTTTKIQTSTRNSTGPSAEMVRRTYRLMFTFEGHCESIKDNEILQIEFLKALMDVTKSTTKLMWYTLEAERILCKPLRVYLRAVTRGLNISHLSEPLQRKIALTDFVVPIIQNTHVLNFSATNLEIVEILSGDLNDLEVAKSGLEVVDIVIISIASFLFAVLVLMMVIVICRECYVRKRTTTFHLRDVPHVNLKLSEFTLTRIPRPQMFYRENSRRKHGPVPVSKIRKPQTNGHSETKDKVKVNQDQIRVRMSKHDDGLVVGVTCSAPPSPTNNSSSCSSTPKNGDSSKTSLLKGSNTENSDGVTNPSYSTDEEMNGNTKIVIQEDENEQLL